MPPFRGAREPDRRGIGTPRVGRHEGRAGSDRAASPVGALPVTGVLDCTTQSSPQQLYIMNRERYKLEKNGSSICLNVQTTKELVGHLRTAIMRAFV